ncbi:C-type mannose receptor 2-like isoform X2 [Boleophthalmus pectinirostris]|uniref:C-type mannose receptor 2-like isoform X2 n=1 Tax=Boleophthalmus pectinirostris TaxID=150288 RepID=UPI00242B3BC4|nr:C-type mannose receptor 2-like isoform X2 [Boleophthalmus pectinirostris]
MEEDSTYVNAGPMWITDRPRRRLKVTVERVALVVLGVLLLAVVAALIGVSVKRSHKTRATGKTTPVPVKTCPNQTYPCDDGWNFNGTKCYYISTNRTKVSWPGARDICQNMGGLLVTIESREEQVFLYHRLALVHKDWFWIGLTDSQTEGIWMWADGSPLNQKLKFWAPGQPDNWIGDFNEYPEAEDCVMMGDPKECEGVDICWTDAYCGSKERFEVCLTEQVKGHSGEGGSSGAQCAAFGCCWCSHWSLCYILHSSVMLRWNESREMCQQQNGASLVKIETREEQVFLTAKLQTLMHYDYEKFWIGLTDSQSEGQWRWTDGSALNPSLAFWANDARNKEPDNWTGQNPNGEDCVRMGRLVNLTELTWYDHSCNLTQRIMCEKGASIC